MILKQYELKKKLDKEKKFFLLYGNNKGLIEETIETILKPSFPKNIYNYDESEILSNIENFYDNLFNQSFFENDKLIIINRVSDKILSIIENILEKNIEKSKIILKTGILEKKSKLRNFFEKHNEILVVPFYEDNHQTLSYLTQAFLDKNNVKISQESINLIIERSKGDRINLLNELNKVKSFCINKKNISTEEILKLTNLVENYSISELVDNSLAKNEKKIFNILNENNFTNDDCIIISRIYLSKLKRLLKIYTELDIKKNLENVLTSFRPPIFWKEKEIVKQQLKRRNYKEVEKLIIDTNEVELRIKKRPSNSVLLITNFILENSVN